MIAHIVLFTPKGSLTDAQTLSFAQSVHATLASVPSIQRCLVGKRVDVDPGFARVFGDATYEYAAVIEFAGRDGLIQYLQHPQHHELGRLFWESCQSTVVSEVEFVDGRDRDAVLSLVK